jgi:hypothetical protein
MELDAELEMRVAGGVRALGGGAKFGVVGV